MVTHYHPKLTVMSAFTRHKIEFLIEYKHTIYSLHLFKSQIILFLVFIYRTKVKSAKIGVFG